MEKKLVILQIRKTFIKSIIFYYLDAKKFIQIKIVAFSYAIYIFLTIQSQNLAINTL